MVQAFSVVRVRLTTSMAAGPLPHVTQPVAAAPPVAKSEGAADYLDKVRAGKKEKGVAEPIKPAAKVTAKAAPKAAAAPTST